MENLIKQVSEKAGISEAQAKTAVDTVVLFLKDKIPAGVRPMVDSFIKNELGDAGEISDEMKEKIGGIFK